jgi:hypothetical protein
MPRGMRWIVAVLLLGIGCGRAQTDRAEPAAQPSASSPPPPAPSARAPKQQSLADQRVEIALGAFLAGSQPGEPGRDPELEPRLREVELGGFEIDRLPYPNDPAQPPLTGVTRDEAKRLCADRDARLCTELEWERACKGPDSDPFPGGAEWIPRCAEEPRTCASGFDVLAMGATIAEWTTSNVGVGSSKGPRAAVRGASAKAPGPQHRCAARRAIDPDSKLDDVGFRCCRGAPNAASVTEPKLGETFVKVKLTAERLEKLFAEDPRTQPIAHDVKFFRDPDAANTVLARGPGDKRGFTFSVSPLRWNPIAGAEYLLVVGRSGDSTSFVVAFHELGANRYKLAASFIMKNEPGPVAFAYDAGGYIRPRLHFSTCWGCPGETGKLLHRKPDSVSILQP